MTKLTLIDRAFFLKRIQLFSRLGLETLLAIADKLQVAVYEEGQTIFRKDEEAYRMYFIVQGEVELLNVHGMIGTLKTDDFFGDESIYNERPRGYSAKTTAETTLLILSKTNLLTILSEYPSVALGLLQAYTVKDRFGV